MNIHRTACSCIILAGGEGRRVGGNDKGLLPYKNKRLIEHVIERMSPQVTDIVISANRNIETYSVFHVSSKSLKIITPHLFPQSRIHA